jgi:transcriptional regulator with XRE-family HTH domain
MNYALDIGGEKLRQARLATGLTRAEAAAKLGITVMHLCHLENGRRQPSNRLADEMTRLYDVHIVDLLAAPEKILAAA